MLEELVGVELGPTSWIDVGQDRIDAFARATDDAQWIHVDPERAAGGPFGGTVAHGFLTLALTVPMLYEVLPELPGTVVNYGVDRVRFPAPLPSGARIRGRLTVEEVVQVERGMRLQFSATVACEGGGKPVCVATLLVLIVS